MSKGSGGTRATNSRSAHGGGANSEKGGGKMGMSKATSSALEKAESEFASSQYSPYERNALQKVQVEAMKEMASSMRSEGEYEIKNIKSYSNKYVSEGSFEITRPNPYFPGERSLAVSVTSDTTRVSVSWSNMQQVVPGFTIREGYKQTFVSSPKELNSYLKSKGYIK